MLLKLWTREDSLTTLLTHAPRQKYCHSPLSTFKPSPPALPSLPLTLASGDHGDAARLAADAEDDRPLHPRHEEMRALPGYRLQDAAETIEYDGSFSTVHCRAAVTPRRKYTQQV